MKPFPPLKTKHFLLGVFFLCCIDAVKAQNNVSLPPVVKAGLEMDRSVLIDKIAAYDSTMIFKQEGDVNGEPNFIGQDKNGNELQLIGTQDMLRIAKWTFAFSPGKELLNKNLDKMAYFVFTLGEHAGDDWFKGFVKELMSTPFEPLTANQGFNFNRKAKVEYNVKIKLFTVTFVELGASF
ncbi:hypothetical protein [uncultured Mucilaginibacter sp.]|uniref:hypothetical protein n=1 Tax=uncultured Mucilaginibacter sp. TaxID=797541 RepID=UPI0025D5D1E7|nr:hypothetical protein [uncultured Mucilaginibacter sp.]